jgi:hypothetical protein
MTFTDFLASPLFLASLAWTVLLGRCVVGLMGDER